MSDQEIDSLLGRLIRQGQAVASEVDREEVVDVLIARTDMSREEATRTVDNCAGCGGIIGTPRTPVVARTPIGA